MSRSCATTAEVHQVTSRAALFSCAVIATWLTACDEEPGSPRAKAAPSARALPGRLRHRARMARWRRGAARAHLRGCRRETPPTPDHDGEVVVNVRREGWSTAEAAALRALPATKKFCECAGDGDCHDGPPPPVSTATVVYRLANDRLNPTAESRRALSEIAAQWGHHAGSRPGTSGCAATDRPGGKDPAPKPRAAAGRDVREGTRETGRCYMPRDASARTRQDRAQGE